MANAALPPIKLLQEPGFLYWAPLGSPTCANTPDLNGKYTDTWPTAWVPLGATDSGTDFNYTMTVSPVEVAELYDPVTYRTTARSGNLSFALASVTLANLTKSFNGAVTTVTAATTTSAATTNLRPTQVGNETRCMLGWESFDSTTRLVGFQVMNSGTIKLSFNKAPARSTIPWVGNFEIPSGTTDPWMLDTTR